MNFDEYFEERDGFPAPRWSALTESKIPLTRENGAAFLDEWSERLWQTLGDSYEIIDTKHFVCVSGFDSAHGDLFAGACERAWDRVLSGLPGVAKAREYPRYLVIAFNHMKVFLRYAASFYPDGGEYGMPAGMHIGDGLGHFIVGPEAIASQERTITHELTHAMLDHLVLPRWLDEGLAQRMAAIAGLRQSRLITAELLDEHREFWNSGNIEQFWSGESFSALGESQKYSYQMAEALVDMLPGKEERIYEFIRNAKWEDGGRAAAQEILGSDLAELISAFLP